MRKEYRWNSEQEQLIISIIKTKGSRISKNTTNKVRKGKYKGIWIPPPIRETLNQH